MRDGLDDPVPSGCACWMLPSGGRAWVAAAELLRYRSVRVAIRGGCDRTVSGRPHSVFWGGGADRRKRYLAIMLLADEDHMCAVLPETEILAVDCTSGDPGELLASSLPDVARTAFTMLSETQRPFEPMRYVLPTDQGGVVVAVVTSSPHACLPGIDPMTAKAPDREPGGPLRLPRI